MYVVIKEVDLTLGRFVQTLDVPESTARFYIKRYLDEFEQLGYVKIVPSSRRRKIIILQPEKILSYLKNKGIILKRKMYKVRKNEN